MKKYLILPLVFFMAIPIVHAQSEWPFTDSERPFNMSEIAAFSIFGENYRTGDYEMALMYGKWLLAERPKDITGVPRFSLERQYERLIDIYAKMAEKVSDPSLKSAYLDTALIIFEDAFITFAEDESFEEYSWHFNRGRFLQENQSSIRNGLNLAYEDYLRAFELDAERLVQAGDGYYIQILLNNYVSNNDRDAALAMIDIAEPLAGPSLADAIDQIRDGLFSDPEERLAFLEERLENNPGDITIITELASMYESMGNRAKALEFAERLYEDEKSFSNIRRLADYAKADGQNRQAIRYLSEALEIAQDDELRKNITIEIAELYQNEGDLQAARRYARQASQIDRSWGEPYLRIADIYAEAVSQCTSAQGRVIDRDDRTVYWLVLDYVDRARAADPSVANAANRRTNSYRPVMPTAEDKFFRGWETGEEFRIDSNLNECYAWINETTRVR
ncbi:MAG: hypothetical protein EA360_10025 [Balneolaceae bacterium]|nr:MAG: hypothetical protein EA360_10025 [Balneolaceae bacterium]